MAEFSSTRHVTACVLMLTKRVNLRLHFHFSSIKMKLFSIGVYAVFSVVIVSFDFYHVSLRSNDFKSSISSTIISPFFLFDLVATADFKFYERDGNFGVLATISHKFIPILADVTTKSKTSNLFLEYRRWSLREYYLQFRPGSLHKIFARLVHLG